MADARALGFGEPPAPGLPEVAAPEHADGAGALVDSRDSETGNGACLAAPAMPTGKHGSVTQHRRK